MIGLVLWSDAEDSKAVFWCEDHGDLAYFDASLEPEVEAVCLNAGDMVSFELTVEDSVRQARRPLVVTPKICNGIQEHLLETASRNEQVQVEPRKTDNVVPFKARTAG